MATGKTHEFKGTTYSEVPDEVAEKLELEPGQDLEFINPYKDLVIIRKKTGEKKEKKEEEKPEKQKGLEEKEVKVLKEIGKIKHWERTPENIKKRLQEDGKKIFNNLLTEGVLFEYEKEGETRIGIDREYFSLATENNQTKNKDTPSSLIKKLEEQGYLVIEDEDLVKDLQEELRKKEKAEEVKGVRGFDKKYYIIKKDKLNEVEDEIKDLLDEEKIIHEVSEDLDIEEKLCKAALVVLREDGEVVEKGKNIYKRS